MNWRHIRQLTAMLWIGTITLFAIVPQVFADDRPLVCWGEGTLYIPAFHPRMQPLPEDYTYSIWPMVRHHLGVMPTLQSHPLGLDLMNRDLFAGLVYGARYSLIIGLGVSLIAMGLGIFMGAIGGYFHDQPLQISFGKLLGALMGIALGYFYGFFVFHFSYTPPPIWQQWSVLLLSTSFGVYGLGTLFKVIGLKYNVPIAPDRLVVGLVNFLEALPTFLWVLALIAFVEGANRGGEVGQGANIWIIISTLGFLSWPGIARVVRAEFIQHYTQNYVASAKALGYTDFRIMLHHILPNLLSIFWVLAVWTLGRAILTEASLSFLGFGANNYISWGKMLYFTGWGQIYHASTLALVCPSLMIFFTVLSLYSLGNYVKKNDSTYMWA
ncbi:MAG: ABC transporter permease [Bacteroidota bacterium]